MNKIYQKFSIKLIISIFIFHSILIDYSINAMHQTQNRFCRNTTHLHIQSAVQTKRDTSPTRPTVRLQRKIIPLYNTRNAQEINAVDFDQTADDRAFTNVIKTVAAISSCLSTCLACAGIIFLGIKSQNN